MPNKISLARARALLAQAVTTQGRDFVYNPGGHGECFYEPKMMDVEAEGPDGPRNKTGCLIGVALSLAGERRHLGSIVSITSVSMTYPDMMSPSATEYFQRAQSAQDAGGSWGHAYAEAEDWAEGWSTVDV